MSKHKKRRRENQGVFHDDWDVNAYDANSVASFSEMTGIAPAIVSDPYEAESLTKIYDAPVTSNKKSAKSKWINRIDG